MRLIISDTGPINYLVLIGHIDILPTLFERVLVPIAVREELEDLLAPVEVRKWIAHPPAWLEVWGPPAHSFEDASLSALGKGEREAIKLAAALQVDAVLLMDDREGVKAALRKGLDTTGTIGLLDKAAGCGLLDLADAFARLRQTTFRSPEDLMQKLLKERKGKTSR